MQTRIIFEDEQVLVCHKPAGLATQTAQVGRPDMVSELKKYLGGAHYLGIIHRLDQPVEGLLVFAKTKEAAAKLTAQLSKGSLNKQYYAVVCGKPMAELGELVDYLCKDKDVARVSERGAAETGAKKAILQYQLVSSAMTEVSQEISLLNIHIDTGRFHQIRVQMAHAGMPLLGDSKYGSAESMELSRKLGLRNVALYAYHVEFEHPVTKKKLEFQIAPQLPKAFGNIS